MEGVFVGREIDCGNGCWYDPQDQDGIQLGKEAGMDYRKSIVWSRRGKFPQSGK
jgi:hypothetical protein